MALLADLTRESQRTKAMATVGMTIGASFMLALVVGPGINGLIGVHGIFWVTAVLAWVGKSEWLFAFSVIVDDVAAAIASVVFVTFISLLVDRAYTATQYALLASIGTAGRTLVAASSGALVDWLDGDDAVRRGEARDLLAPEVALAGPAVEQDQRRARADVVVGETRVPEAGSDGLTARQGQGK